MACIPKSVIFRPFSGFLPKGATLSLRIIFFKSITLIFLHSYRVGELRTMQFEMLETMARWYEQIRRYGLTHKTSIMESTRGIVERIAYWCFAKKPEFIVIAAIL